MRRADFDRILSTRSAARTAHFALHRADRRRCEEKLSTGQAPDKQEAVDNCPLQVGFAVPKRYARRAVTRNLIKRQMRAAALRHRGAFCGSGASKWVLRLRAPFVAEEFPSAASQSLKHSVRDELDALLAVVSSGSNR